MPGKLISVILVALSIILAVIFFYIWQTGDTAFRMELLKEAAKTILQLVLLGLLGAFASFLFTEYTAGRDRKIAQHKSRLEALNTLTRLYWETRKAFDIIDAHRSAKSYGEQMRQMIEYRIELERLDNEIAAGMYGVAGQARAEIGNSLSSLIRLLRKVIEEWKTQYLRLSRLQAEDEKQVDPKKKKVPQEIDQLPVLACLRQNNFQTLHKLFEEAAGPIREQLRSDLESPR